MLNPSFTPDDIKALDEEDAAAGGAATSSGSGNGKWRRALDGHEFLPGMVGLNNLKQSGYANVVIMAMQRIKPIRNFFLDQRNFAASVPQKKGPATTTALVDKFSELCRKMWNPRAFKGQVG